MIQKTYLGTEGTLGVTITNNNGPINIARGTTVDIELNGYNLAGTTPTVIGPAGAQLTATVVSSAATRARVRITSPADAAFGNAQLVMSSSAGQATLALRVIDLSLISLGVEDDTRLLWHLNETANGATTIFDETPLRNHGASGSLSLAQPGRFDGGRASANIATVNGNPNLVFGSSSFTVEGWVKTDVVGRTYCLFGKEDVNGGTNATPEFSVRLFPNGMLRGLTFDTSFRFWVTDLPASVYRVDDNQWHYIAMVIDRTINKMSLYVDGLERASTTAPAGFAGLTNASQAFRVAHWAINEPQTTGGDLEFPGVIDEVRVSISAHSAARLLNDMVGTSPLRITSYSPKEVLREKAGLPSTITPLVVIGYNLDGVTGRLVRDGQTVDAVVNVVSSSSRLAIVEVDAQATAPLGTAQLVLSKPGQTDVAVDLRISEQAQIDGALDTLLVWNLNETGNGAVRVFDNGALGIHGTAGVLSQEQPGRYGRGRSRPNIFSDPDKDALYLGSFSFTAECWMRTTPVSRSYTLVGKEDLRWFELYA